MKRALLALGALALATALPVSVKAEEAVIAQPTRRAALSIVAAELAAQLRAVPSGALIIVAPLTSDEAAPRADGLATRVGTALSGAMGRGAMARPDPLSLPAARSAGRSAGSFVYVRAEIASGMLQVSADLYPVAESLWDRIFHPNPPPSLHAFASARVDAEVRSFLSPVPLVLGKTDRARIEDRDLLAIACGDVDDDGALEIVAMGRRRVQMGRLRQGKFAASHTASWSELSPVAPAPMREAMGSIALSRRGVGLGSFIDVGLSDRAHGVRLDASLRPIEPIHGLPISFGERDLCAHFPNGIGTPSFASCAKGDAAPGLGPLSSPADVVATGTIVTQAGTSLTVLAVREPKNGDLRLVSRGFVATIPAVGAQVAIADLDSDGIPEIISSLDVLTPGEDALVVTSWNPGESAQERARIPVPLGVSAISACPPEGSGPAPIAIATAQGEVWVVR